MLKERRYIVCMYVSITLMHTIYLRRPTCYIHTYIHTYIHIHIKMHKSLDANGVGRRSEDGGGDGGVRRFE